MTNNSLTTEGKAQRRRGKKTYRALSVNLESEQWDRVDALAVRQYHGNRSMAAEAAFKLLLDAEDKETP